MTALSEPPITSETSDLALAERARVGDSEAFGELYRRYFTPIHDFVYRMVRNPQDAADVTQEAFLRALRSIEKLDEPGAVRGWLYTIARNTALNRLRVPVMETVERVPLGEDGDAAFDVVDPDAFADPAEAAEARAMSRLVWEAAAGLSVSEYTLLDLHVRHELGGAEIAKVLGTSPNSVYVRLNRARKTFERSVKALVLMRSGKESCDRLARLLAERKLDRMSPEALRVVEDHARDCDECDRRRGALLAPLTVFGALAPVGADPSLYAGLLASVTAASAAGAAGAAAGSGGGAGVAGGASGSAGILGSGGAAGGIAGGLGATGLAVAAATVAIAAAALLLPFSPFALLGGEGGALPVAVAGESPTATVTQAIAAPPQVTATASLQSATATPTPTPTDVVAGAITQTPLAPAAAGPGSSPTPDSPPSPSNDPIEVDTIEVLPTVAVPTATGEPATPVPATVTPSATATATATGTPVPPIVQPSEEPSPQAEPTSAPSASPSPTLEPTSTPETPQPTASPTPEPTSDPSPTPSPTPTPVAEANVVLSVLASGSLPVLNLPFLVEVVVENEGPATAEDIAFQSQLPLGVVFLEATSSTPGVLCMAVAGLLGCTIDELLPGESASVFVLLLLAGLGGDLTLDFSLLETDGSPAPQFAQLALDVLEPAVELMVEFEDDGTGTAKVQYTVLNTGDLDLENVEVADPGCPVVSAVDFDASGLLAPGESREFVCDTAPRAESTGEAFAQAESIAGAVSSPVVGYTVDLLPSVAVTRAVSPSSVTAPGGDVTVRFVVTNTGSEPLELLAANDSELGPIDELCGLPSVLQEGETISCELPSTVAGEAGNTIEAIFEVLVRDDEGNEVAEYGVSAVSVVAPPLSALEFEFLAPSPYFEAQVALVDFTFRLTNNAPGAVFVLGLQVLGPGVNFHSLSCSGVIVVLTGATQECVITLRITGAVGLDREPGIRMLVQRLGATSELLERTVTLTGCAGPGQPGEPQCPWSNGGGAGGTVVLGAVLALVPSGIAPARVAVSLGVGLVLLAAVSTLAMRGARR